MENGKVVNEAVSVANVLNEHYVSVTKDFRNPVLRWMITSITYNIQ